MYVMTHFQSVYLTQSCHMTSEYIAYIAIWTLALVVFVPHGAWQPWTLYWTEKIHHKFSFCVTKKKKSYKNNPWINNDITCIFGWTIPLSVLHIILFVLCWPDLFSHVLWGWFLHISLQLTPHLLCLSFISVFNALP